MVKSLFCKIIQTVHPHPSKHTFEIALFSLFLMLGALYKVWIFQGKDMGNVSNFFLKLSTVVRIEIFFKCLYDIGT